MNHGCSSDDRLEAGPGASIASLSLLRLSRHCVDCVYSVGASIVSIGGEAYIAWDGSSHFGARLLRSQGTKAGRTCRNDIVMEAQSRFRISILLGPKRGHSF